MKMKQKVYYGIIVFVLLTLIFSIITQLTGNRKIFNLFQISSSTILLPLLTPYLDYLLFKLIYGKSKRVDELTEEQKVFLKENKMTYEKIANWSFGIPMIIGFIILFNFHKFDINLPHLLLSNDYTGLKIFVIAIFSIAYWGYFIIRFISLSYFGNKNGILMTEFAYVPVMKKNGEIVTSENIIKHPYQKLYGNKVILIAIISLLILFI